MSASASRRHWSRRLVVPAIMLAGGTALTAATAAGGGSAVAVAALGALTVVFTAAYWWWAGRGESDMAALVANRPDERQRSIDLTASALAGIVVCVFCLGAAVVSLARGGSGYPWAGLDALFGVSYAVCFAVLRRLR